MDMVYFMHCVFEDKDNAVPSVIDDYFNMTFRRVFFSERFQLVVVEMKGLKFRWAFRPNNNDFYEDDISIESEVLIKSSRQNGQNTTEVRITFTDNVFLEFYFAKLAEILWERFSISEKNVDFPKLMNQPLFYSADAYLRAERKRRAESKKVFDVAFSNKKARGNKSAFSFEERLKYVKKWYMQKDHITKEDFLIQEFGKGADGNPNVPISTFNTWCQNLKDHISG